MQPSSALIGYSGFVGQSLLRQTSFGSLYRSNNIGEIVGNEFDLIVCAGAPAQKWLANKNPESDERTVHSLMSVLRSVKAKSFVLISTVDVFKDPQQVNEESIPEESGLNPYGLNRLKLEKFIRETFNNHLIVRLPGLVGPGLRKNVIFDILNSKNLDNIDRRNQYQFYPMVNLWYDLQIAIQNNIKLLHLTAEPITVETLARAGFGITFNNELNAPPVRYDFQSKLTRCFGSDSPYHYTLSETIQAVRAYAQTEPKTQYAS